MDWTSLCSMVMATAALMLVLMGVISKPGRDHRLPIDFPRAVDSFRMQREHVEAKFLDLARWIGNVPAVCRIEYEWQRNATFARDLETDLITAFVAIGVRFVEVRPGKHGDFVQINSQCDATALFHYRDGWWETSDCGFLHVDPVRAVIRLQDHFEPIPTEDRRCD